VETGSSAKRNLKVFVAHREPWAPIVEDGKMSYQLSPDATYQVLELFLYVMGFFTAVLIFLYIASERPPEKREKKEEKESE
jgi:hypothetical protein